MYVKRGGYGEIRQLNRCEDWLFNLEDNHALLSAL